MDNLELQSKMEVLDDDALILIMEQLDNRTMMSAMKTCRRFATVFSNSYLIKKFTLTITSLNIDFYLKQLLDVPIVNLVFNDLGVNTRGLYFPEAIIQKMQGRHLPPPEKLDKVMTLIEKYGESIMILELKNFHVDSEKTFMQILSGMKNLKELKINSCVMLTYDPTYVHEDLPKIEAVTLDDCQDEFFGALKNLKTLNKLKFIKNDRNEATFNYSLVDDLLAAVPSIKHLILEGSSIGGYLARGLCDFKFTLHSLKVDQLNSGKNEGEPRLNFLKSQQGHLRELRIKKMPYDFDGDEILKFIVEEMKLESFYYHGVAFIKDGKKVKGLKDLWISQWTLKAGIEMLKQFPDITNLTFNFKRNGDRNEDRNEASLRLLNTKTEIFKQLTSLKVNVENESQHDLLIAFVKNCEKISQLEIMASSQKLKKEFFRDCLPRLLDLREMKLDVQQITADEEIFQTILNFKYGLKKVVVHEHLVEEARNVFGGAIHVEPFTN